VIRRRNALARFGLRPLSLALHRAHRTALRRPRTVLVAAAVVAVGFGAAASRGRMALSVPDLVGRHTRAVGWLDRMQDDFGGGHSLLLAFTPATPGEPLSASALEDVRLFLERARREDPEVSSAFTPWDARRAVRVDGRLVLRPVLEDGDTSGLAPLAQGPLGRFLTDRDGGDVAAMVVFRDSLHPGLFGRFDPSPVGALLARAAAEVGARHPEVRILAGDAAAFEWWALRAQARIDQLDVAVVILLLLACRALLGTWRSGFLLVGTVAWAGLVVYGGLALMGLSVDMLTSGLFLLLAVAAIEDFLFLAWERAGGTAWRTAFRRLLLPGGLTSLTTFIGFASLCTADLAIVRRFGLWGALGAALEWIATFVVLPAALTLRPSFGAWSRPERALPHAWVERVARLRLPRGVAWAALLVLPLAGLAAANLRYADAASAFFAPDHPFRRAAEEIRRTRGWEGAIHVVFPEDASPGEVARAARRLERLPGVAHVLDPAAVLDWTTGGEALARYELAGELERLPAAGLRGRGGRLRAVVFLSSTDVTTVLGVRDAVLRAYPEGDGFPAGELVAYAEFAEVVPVTLMRSLGTCLAAVALVLWLLYRAVGLGGGGRAVLASALGPAVALCALWASRLPVTFVTAVFASVVVGLTGDNAVQFACAASGRSLRLGLARRAGAAALVSVVMAACALLFLASVFAPPRGLGALLAVGLLAALAGDTWVLGALWGGSPSLPGDRSR